MKKYLLIPLILLGPTCFAQEEIKSVPDMVLKNIDGKSVNLKDYAANGKITVLSFWATWCSHCAKELTNISEIYDEWVEKYGLELVAISTDNARNAAKVKPYADGLGMDFEILLDPNEELKRAMNVTGIPFTYILNKEGIIVYKHQGYAEGDEYILEEEFEKLK